jgi:hypothetical protein
MFDVKGADGMPERVVIDLEDKDPNKFRVLDENDDGQQQDQQQDDIDAGEQDLRGEMNSRENKRISRLRAELGTVTTQVTIAAQERDGAVAALQAANAEIARLRSSETTAATALGSSMLTEREKSMDLARSKLAAAHEAGNAKDIADATAEIAQLAADISAIKARIPVQPRQDPTQQQQPPQQQQQPQRQAPPQQQVTMAPNVAAWISHNRGWFGQPGHKERTDLAYATHNALVSRGVQPASPEYTRELDRALKAVYTDHVPFAPQGTKENQNGGRMTRTNVVADGSREDSLRQPRVVDTRHVELSASQLALAKRLNVTPQAYAKELVKQQQKEGAQ